MYPLTLSKTLLMVTQAGSDSGQSHSQVQAFRTISHYSCNTGPQWYFYAMSLPTVDFLLVLFCFDNFLAS